MSGFEENNNSNASPDKQKGATSVMISNKITVQRISMVNKSSKGGAAVTTGPTGKKVNQSSTKCASSNSTCEPSTNNLVSSIKSSLIETPASPALIQPPLSQSELKEKTRESNLIVCLYYNLACCYQRLGLLDEAVEYLELASDQLEDTVQFFEV